MLRMTGVLVIELLKASGVTLYQHYYHMPVWCNTCIHSIVTTKLFIYSSGMKHYEQRKTFWSDLGEGTECTFD